MASENPVVKVTYSLIATKYTFVISATILIWDMTLTMEEECKRVWKARKTFGTSLFLWNRYLPPAIFFLDLTAQFRWNPTTEFCKNYELSSTLLSIVAIAIVQCVFIMRTHALYQSRAVLYLLATLALISIVNMVVCFLIVINLETFVSASEVLGLTGCLSGCVHSLCRPLLVTFWIPYVCFETTIFLLTAWKLYTCMVDGPSTRSSKLITVLFRDGLVYYLVIMGTSFMNFFIWIFDPFASYLAVGLLKCLQATICSRMLLHIRGLLEPQYINAMQSSADAIPLSTVRNQPSEVIWAQGPVNAETDAAKGGIGDAAEAMVENSDYLPMPARTERTPYGSTSGIK